MLPVAISMNPALNLGYRVTSFGHPEVCNLAYGQALGNETQAYLQEDCSGSASRPVEVVNSDVTVHIFLCFLYDADLKPPQYSARVRVRTK